MSNHNLKSQSAESYMVDGVLTALKSDSVGFIQKELIEKVANFDTISYIYVVSKSNKLIGVLSIQELFAAKKTSPIEDIMTKDVKTIRRSTLKEKVVIVALRHNLKSVPVVDKKGTFVGIVPSDEILSILSNSHLEDALLSAGISSTDDPIKDIKEPSVIHHLKKRFPWLVLGLSGSFITTFIVGSFDSMLEKQILLATFIPAIVYMSDAVGNQTQTIFIKAMAMSSKIDFVFYMFRETKIALVLGMILSTIVFLISALLWKSPIISFIFGFSLLMAVIGASIMAIILPIILKKFKIDPAVASGPMASVMRDIYSLSIYLSFARLLLKLFG
jgi:magnesium transporter